MEQRLAYHEAGHFIMNFLVTNLALKAVLEIPFPKANSVKINLLMNTGETQNSGFPIDNWSLDNIHRITNFYFDRNNFYSSNKNFATAHSLILISGHTIEAKYNRPDRLDYLSFGNELGENMDKNLFDRIVIYLMKNKYDSILDENYLAEKEGITESLRTDIVQLTENEAIDTAIKVIVDKLINAEINDQGEKIIMTDRLTVLENELQQIIGNYSIQEMINKY